MVDSVDIGVKGQVKDVQALVQRAFMANEFEVKWTSPLKGKAEKGSKGANLALGAFAQYYAVNFEIFPQGAGTTLRLAKGNTGMAGGIWGMSKVNKQFNKVADTLADWFQQQGALLGVQKR